MGMIESLGHWAKSKRHELHLCVNRGRPHAREGRGGLVVERNALWYTCRPIGSPLVKPMWNIDEAKLPPVSLRDSVHSMIGLRWIAMVIATVCLLLDSSNSVVITVQSPPADSASELENANRVSKALETDEFDTKDVIAASGWIESSHVADWLGPLAPVALSPFFGITCLSGLALWGPSSITDNALLGSAGPLQNPTLFFVFLGLTLLTSAPRFTKVSKPFAQAVDRLETYSVIVILLVVKVISSMESDDNPADQVAMVQLGIVSFSASTLLSIAMVINVLVINSVKFFFEFLVWLTPIPFLDACFEVLNKTLCAGLMALYAFSPTLATLVNLILLVMAAIVLRWISRRVRFYRTMVLDPIIASLWRGFGTPRRPELIVFPKNALGPFSARVV